ncbi:MAG: hypothetical protein VKJ46_15510 [Leptolyngbyaceae bacterium]|nr:hypothetical protein [Leptolyngbyaceae bacterium]
MVIKALKSPSLLLTVAFLLKLWAPELRSQGIQCPTQYIAPAFTGRAGKIAFNNETDQAIFVTLFHPNIGQVFSTYKVAPKQNIYLGNNMVVGNDWGIRVPNSGICNVEAVSDYRQHGDQHFIWQTSSQRFLRL